MDPNANLQEQRRLAMGIIERSDKGLPAIEIYAVRLAELALAMDEWLANGGFLPGKWER